MKKYTKYHFRKGGDVLYATADGWTNAYTPDGDMDSFLENNFGEQISEREALEMLEEYGWAICEKCGRIYPALGDCAKCIYGA